MSAPANLAAVIESTARAHGWGSRVAFAVENRTLRHAEVHDRAALAASRLAEVGVVPGERVLLALPDGEEFVVAFLATVRLGAVVVPVNPRLTVEDHRYMAADSRARVVVCEEELAPRFAGAPILVGRDLTTSLEGRSPHAPAAVSGDDPAYALYTSGTTGAPKAALHRHGDPPVYFDAFARGAIDMGPDDVVLSVSKMYFAYGLGNSLFFPLLSGARAVLHPGRPRPEHIAQLAERHRPTILFAVPTFYAHLVRSASPSPFTSLRVAVSAGEPLTVALAGRARSFLGCPVLDGLGSTEVGQTFVSNTVAHCRDGTVGRPLAPYEVSVRDEHGRDVGLGEVGTLWVRGPTVLLEYLGKPEATAALRQGEWLCTGDRAALDADGFVHLHGRVDDLEMVGGISVAPREIEELISAHPAVMEVAVVSVRDAEGASQLTAFVVPAPGAGPPETVADELLALARDRLAPYKVPRSVIFLEALPRTATGKLRRFLLRTGADSLTPR